MLGKRLRLGVLGLAIGLAGCAAPSGEDASDSADAISTPTPEAAGWSSEADLSTSFRDEIEPYFFEHAKRGTFAGVDGVSIAYASLIAPKEKAAIVLFTGRTESYVKYAEVAYDLHRHGYSLYLIDHRGQGFSGRMLPDREKGYVKHFGDYVTDATSFIDQVVRPAHHKRLFALGHSMGGLILSHYLVEHPNTFRAAVLSSPMFKVKLPFWLGELGVSALNVFNDSTDYVVGKGPYKTGRANAYQHSATRFKLFYDGLESEFPEIRLGGATKQWLNESMAAGEVIRARAESLTTPLLLVRGELDEVVDNAAQDAVCKAARRCTPMPAVGGGHEVLMEKDELRTAALEAITNFIDAR